MLKNAKFRLPLLLLALALQILATESGQPSQFEVTKRKSAPIPPAGESKPAEAELGAKSSTVKHHERLFEREAEDQNRKFQARMMDEPDRGANTQQIKRQDVSSDSWQTHALVPTFTDQEQGDEMVALASDQPPERDDEIKMPQRANRSMSTRERLTAMRGEYAQQASQPPQLDKMSSEAANKARLNLQDEYEVDEDDDAEEEPGRLSSVAADYEPAMGADHKQARASKKFKPLLPSGLEYVDYAPQYDQSNKARQLDQTAPVANRSATNLVQAIDSGWLPAAQNSQFSEEPQPQSQGPKSAYKSPQVSKERPTSMGERLAGFFGGREGLNKADVAIEYLRTMLRNKQSQMSNSTQSTSHLQEYSDNLRGHNLDSKAERGYGNDRISMLTSRLNKILNATVSQTNNTNEPPKSAEPTLDQSHKPSQTAQLLAAADQPNGRVRQSGSKFSISDAKSTAQLEFTSQQQLSQSMPSTTKLPSEPVYSSEPYQNGASIRPRNQPSQSYSDQIAALSTNLANGTPLGGDYIEGLDDYPRYSQEQQRHVFTSQQRPGLHESQSQIVHIRQEPPKAEQTSEHSRHVSDQGSQQASAASQPHHVPIESAFQQPQPNNIPERLVSLQRQYEGPRSSRYFRMHQFSEIPRQVAIQEQEHPKAESVEKPPAQEIRSYPGPNKQVSSQNKFPQESTNHSDSTPGASKYEETREQAPVQQKLHPQKLHPQKSPNYPETNPHSPAHQEQILRPPLPQSAAPHSSISSSKIYGISEQPRPQMQLEVPKEAKIHREPQQAPIYHTQPNQFNEQPVAPQVQPAAKTRPPKIVSYNYFESPNEQGKDSELMATNYQLADALYSSSGELGQMLSNTELEAIQSQFLTAEHPLVPIPAYDGQASPGFKQQHSDQSLAGLLANLRPEDYPPPEALQKIMSSAKHAEEALKELASNEQPVSALPPVGHNQDNIPAASQMQGGNELRKLLNQRPLEQESKKRKSLIVYLNHPRPVDMSKASLDNDGHNLAQSVSDQSSLESFISAKEFDTQGLSKDTKHLDVSSLRGFGDSKEGQDKDGLSVVVIGDAYKYKKIVLLISSKSGGLKFIPMVKDI